MVDQNNIEQCCAAHIVQSCQQYFVPQKRFAPPPKNILHPLEKYYTFHSYLSLSQKVVLLLL